MNSSQRTFDFEAASADDGGGGGDEQAHQVRPYAYWMMAGYLGGRVRSIKEAYEKGFDILLDLVYKEKVLKLSDNDRGMIEFVGSSTNANCRHRGFCVVMENLGFLDMLFLQLGNIGKTVLSKDEMLSLNRKGSKLRADPGSYFYHHLAEDQELNKYLAVFNPTPDSLKPLLENVKSPSVLLLRGIDELSPQSDCFPLDRLRTLTILEISGSTRLTTIPLNTISQLIHLQSLNLSDLPIEEFPSSFFRLLSRLRWLILRGCYKLWTLDLNFIDFTLQVLDLSHCTALQNLVISSTLWAISLRMLDLSYTTLDPLQRMLANTNLTHLYLRGSKLEDLNSFRYSQRIEVLDLSGSSLFTKLDEVFFNELSRLLKLDLSWTKVKRLPSLANLTSLCELSLRGLELDSLESLSSLPNQLVELDLTGLKIISSLELKLDFLQSLENLQILNLSQTSVAKLPDISKHVRLKEILLADCQHLKVVPDLQALTNLETIDLSLPSNSSSVNRQLEIETEGRRGLPFFPFPRSLRKLVLTNRFGVQKLFHLTTLANLEFLDLRGTDVTGWEDKLQEEQPQERTQVKKEKQPVEIHVVSVDDESNSQQLNQPSSLEHFDDGFVKWDALISDIQKNLNSAMAQEQVEMLRNDLRYIRENFVRLMSSSNWKSSKELLQEFMDAAPNLSAADFSVDSANFKHLLRIVIKLKLLVPPKQIDNLETLEVTKKKTKKKPLFKRSQSKENDVITDIVHGMQRMEPDLLSSYKSLSTIQKDCLLCFSIFPYNEDGDKNIGIFKSLVIKKKILIYWWVGEGIIDPHHEESVDPKPTLNDQEMMMSREIDATEQFATTKGVENPKTIEEIGKQILKVLEEKGFIESVKKKGQESGSCCIHPFVHSFVIERAKEEGFFDFDQKSGKLAPHFTRSRRACLLKPHDSVPSSCKLWANFISSPNKLKSFKTVKTLFNVNDSMVDIKQEWFSKMKNLFVLHLGNWRSENTDVIEVNDQKFLEDLKKMRQLRLLSLQGLPTIMKLPDSICYLRNLIILDLKECSYLEELPADIGSLKSLTHLDMSNCPLLFKLPKGISLLLKLEVLRGFLITDQQVTRDPEVIKCVHGLFRCKSNESCTLKDLLKLKRLRELSIVVNISNFPEDKDLKVFKEMKKLCKLKILWQRSICSEDIKSATGQESSVGPSRWQNKLTCWKRQQSQNSGEENDREESKHLDSIEKLELWCFPYENIPYWLNPGELRNLKRLYIVGGNLRSLHGSGWKVETLRLKYLRNLDIQWRELKIMFPQLMHLEKYQCDQLVLFPCNEEGVWSSAS